MFKKVGLLIVFLVTSFFNLFAQTAPSDSSQLLQLNRLNISLNSSNKSPNVPSFEEFHRGFTFGNRLIISTPESVEIESFAPRSQYVGLMINFLFDAKLLNKKSAYNREFFTAAFEAGGTSTDLYQLTVNDTLSVHYKFGTNVFRLTVGYRRFLTKRDRKFKFYTGIELVNEIQISAFVSETTRNPSDALSTNVDNERKLFAKKGYSPYLNFPLGCSFRFSGKKNLHKAASVFLHSNLAIGSQQLDPFRITGFYNGTRLGFTFGI